MARSVYMQAGIVRDNVLKLIQGRQASHLYKPRVWVEGAISVTVGKVSLRSTKFSFFRYNCLYRKKLFSLICLHSTSHSCTCQAIVAKTCCLTRRPIRTTLELQKGGTCLVPNFPMIKSQSSASQSFRQLGVFVLSDFRIKKTCLDSQVLSNLVPFLYDQQERCDFWKLVSYQVGYTRCLVVK